MKLSLADFEQAQRFVQEQARPVDRALYHFYFTGGPPEAVLAELAYYQNGDGGFGHGLEPDFRTPVSSPMATSVALQYVEQIGTPMEHPLVRRAIAYLVAAYQTDGDYWPDVPLAVNDAPHAPWWGREAITPPTAVNWANPSAELAGYIHQYADLVPDWLSSRTLGKMETVLSAGAFNPDFPFYNLMCWERTLPAIPAPLAAKIEAHLHEAYQQLHPLTPEKLGEVRIFMLVQGPDSVLAQLYPEMVAGLLDQEIERQAGDGSWQPGWEWGVVADVWPTAQREWAGKLTLECLLILRNFDKLEF